MTVDGKEVQYKMGTEDGSRWSFDWDGTPKSKNNSYFYSVSRDGFAPRLNGNWRGIS